MATDSGSTPQSVRDTPSSPNVLWIFLDDMNPWMSCYGDDSVRTDNIDALADRGVRLDRLYATAPVCTPSRSAVITGMYQTTIGAHNHYSSYQTWRDVEMEQWDPTHLGVRTIPEIFRSAGYYTFNEGKNHYNFVDDDRMLYDRHGTANRFHGAEDGTEWDGREPGQPFFGQIQLPGGKASVSTDKERVDPEEVVVPPYYPDHEIYRQEIAHHYDTISEMDDRLGDIVSTLQRDELLENTIIWFFADHGMKLPRHKQFCYEGGIRVPGIIAGPGVPSGRSISGLVSGIDIGPTSLALAGIDIPPHMQGQHIFDPLFNREYVISARDRCDYTIDRIRVVVTEEYKYIRNFMTDRPYLQTQYRDGRACLELLREKFDAGELTPEQARFVSDERPAEELYDLREDPYETENLIHSRHQEHQEVLGRLRSILHRWITETNDQGRFPESDDALRAVLDRWDEEAVNEEFDRVR